MNNSHNGNLSNEELLSASHYGLSFFTPCSPPPPATDRTVNVSMLPYSNVRERMFPAGEHFHFGLKINNKSPKIYLKGKQKQRLSSACRFACGSGAQAASLTKSGRNTRKVWCWDFNFQRLTDCEFIRILKMKWTSDALPLSRKKNIYIVISWDVSYLSFALRVDTKKEACLDLSQFFIDLLFSSYIVFSIIFIHSFYLSSVAKHFGSLKGCCI